MWGPDVWISGFIWGSETGIIPKAISFLSMDPPLSPPAQVS